MKRAIDITIKNYGQTGTIIKKHSSLQGCFYFMPDGQSKSRVLLEHEMYRFDDTYNYMFYFPKDARLIK